MVWTLIEPGVAIIASSLATIRPLLRAMGIRGFQFTEHSTRPRGNPKSNQSSNDAQRSCIGSTDIPLPDIELAHTKGRVTWSTPDAGTMASRGLPPKFSARRMSRVEEGRNDRAPPQWPLPLQPDVASSDDNTEAGEAKSLESGYRRVEIRRNDTNAGNNNNVAKSQTLHPGSAWLESSDRLSQFSSRDSSVDYSGLQAQHSPLSAGLDTPQNWRS